MVGYAMWPTCQKKLSNPRPVNSTYLGFQCLVEKGEANGYREDIYSGREVFACPQANGVDRERIRSPSRVS